MTKLAIGLIKVTAACSSSDVLLPPHIALLFGETVIVLFENFFPYLNMIILQALGNISSLNRKRGGNCHRIVVILRSGFSFQFPV